MGIILTEYKENYIVFKWFRCVRCGNGLEKYPSICDDALQCQCCGLIHYHNKIGNSLKNET